MDIVVKSNGGEIFQGLLGGFWLPFFLVFWILRCFND